MDAVILDRFAHDVGRAYSLMLEELAKLLKDMDLTAELRLGTAASVRLTIVEELDPATHDDRQKRALKIIGRCGGRVGAAARRARTAIALVHLDRLAASGHDLTATTANNIAKQAGGTGLGRLARAKYGTPGRTAADKSTIQASPAAEATSRAIRADLAVFREKSMQIRSDMAEQWLKAWGVLGEEESPFVIE